MLCSYTCNIVRTRTSRIRAKMFVYEQHLDMWCCVRIRAILFVHEHLIYVLLCVYTNFTTLLLLCAQVLVARHSDHWSEECNMPDVSDRPSIAHTDMQLWKKQRRKSRLKPHSTCPGSCGKWLNTSYDFALEYGKVPVRFKDKDDVLNDLMPEFVVTVWVRYVSLMVCR